MKKLSIMVPVPIHRKLKAAAALQGMGLAEFVEFMYYFYAARQAEPVDAEWVDAAKKKR